MRCLFTILKVLVPVVLLSAAAVGILYVRLLNGPVSLKMFASALERAIGAEMPQFQVTVEDAYVLLTEDTGVEFRLSNLRFSDGGGHPVAVAPKAALSLSRTALWYGQIAPERIVLIEPQLRLSLGKDGRVSLSLPGDGRGVAEGVEALRRTLGDSPEPTDAAIMPVDVGKLIADTRVSLARSSQVTSFLKGIGFRDARLLLDHEGRQSSWLLQSGQVGIEREGGRGRLTGGARVVAHRASWSIEFDGVEDDTGQGLSLKVGLVDFVPSSIAPLVPELGPVAMLSTPVTGEVQVKVGGSGVIEGATASLALKEGALVLPGTVPFGVEGGELKFSYSGHGGGFNIQSSTLRWGRNTLTVAGVASPVTKVSGEVWRFGFRLIEGRIEAPEFGVAAMPVEQLDIEGEVAGGGTAIEIEKFAIGAGGGQVQAAGRMAVSRGGISQDFRGRISSLGINAVKAAWPRGLNPVFRKWSGEQVLAGTFKHGTFSYSSQLGSRSGGRPQSVEERKVKAVFEAEDLKIEPEQRTAPVVMKRALVRVDDDVLEVDIPEGSMLLPSGAKLQVRQGKLLSTDLWSPRGTGVLSFKVSGGLAAGLEMLEQDGFGIGQPLGRSRSGLSGQVQGTFSVTLPLGEDLGPEDVKVRGEGKVSGGEWRGLFGRHSVKGAALDFSINERNVEGNGKFLVSGVPATITWQRVLGAEAHEQPALRLTANLDDSDRTQLGIGTGGILHGETRFEVLVSPRKNDAPNIRVVADIGKAELLFRSLAWRKGPGVAGSVAFEVVEEGNERLLLKDFKASGPDMAVSGEVRVSQKRGIESFSFPNFTLDLSTHLDVQGRLKSKNLWELKVKGRTFDGRNFYRSLFSVGTVDGAAKVPQDDDADLDLRAEIEHVVGFDDVGMRSLDLTLMRRKGNLENIQARGIVDSGQGNAGQPLVVTMSGTGKRERRLVASSDDAGQVFRMVGFYPNMQGGKMQLAVNLDGSGAAEKTGQLFVRQFRIFGDQVVGEVLQAPDESGRKRRREVIREVLEFDWMRVPFSVGYGQFVMHGADVRGPLLGVTLKGKADYRSRTVNLGGTYVPLQGLNAMFKDIPLLGQILSGPNGEGVLGVTFAIQGPMSQPQVLVNPLSMVAPGIFREMFQMTNPSPKVIPADTPGWSNSKVKRKSIVPRSSAAPAVDGEAGRRSGGQVDKDGGWRSNATGQD